MKLKFNCKVYDKTGEVFTVLSEGTEIDVIEVDKRTVKIEWEREDGKWFYGYVAHRQFMICIK